MAATAHTQPKRPQPATIPTASDRIVRLQELIQLSGKSRTSIYRDISAGTFPAGFSIGLRSRGWSLNSINTWLDNCKAGGAV